MIYKVKILNCETGQKWYEYVDETAMDYFVDNVYSNHPDWSLFISCEIATTTELNKLEK